MERFGLLRRPHRPDWQALVDNILRRGTPRRVHHMELFHDGEISTAIAERFDLMKGISTDDTNYGRWKRIRVNRFCGLDYVAVGLLGVEAGSRSTEDTAALPRAGGRSYLEEHVGVITNWEQFEKYPWPDLSKAGTTAELEWFTQNLPEDMCLVCFTGHCAEFLTWLMGYETLCFALHDNRALVQALADRIQELHEQELGLFLQFDRVKMAWASDDMGFKTGLLISPPDMRRFVLGGHKKLARMAHAAGRPYLLHSCGQLAQIIDDLTDDVKIDAKHSFEDTIEDVRQVKNTYGRKIALIGGIDMDFLCRADEAAIRKRVRDTLDICMPGGGYCLGTGNSVANYIPLDHYLAMVDEGMLYGT